MSQEGGDRKEAPAGSRLTAGVQSLGLTFILSLSSDPKPAFWSVIQGDIISCLYSWAVRQTLPGEDGVG